MEKLLSEKKDVCRTATKKQTVRHVELRMKKGVALPSILVAGIPAPAVQGTSAFRPSPGSVCCCIFRSLKSPVSCPGWGLCEADLIDL